MYLGISNGYIKSGHDEPLYTTPENVGNCALTASTFVFVIIQLLLIFTAIK